jgi:hypothetical protein
MGIINPDGINEKWLAPIGKKLVVSKEITGINPPETLDGFSDMVIGLREKLGGSYPPAAEKISDDVLKKFAIEVSHVFVKSAPSELMHWAAAIAKLKETGTPKTLPGMFVQMLGENFKDDILMLKYNLQLSETLDVRVVFNCSSNCMVWVDGEFAFGRECGRMAPSPHRCPINQYKDMQLAIGLHELIAAVYKPEKTDSVQWVCGLADGKTLQWMVMAKR